MAAINPTFQPVRRNSIESWSGNWQNKRSFELQRKVTLFQFKPAIWDAGPPTLVQEFACQFQWYTAERSGEIPKRWSSAATCNAARMMVSETTDSQQANSRCIESLDLQSWEKPFSKSNERKKLVSARLVQYPTVWLLNQNLADKTAKNTASNEN